MSYNRIFVYLQSNCNHCAMTKEEYQSYIERYNSIIEAFRQDAHNLHQRVNQIYGDHLPYGFHLDMVAEGVLRYGHHVCACEEDVLPLFFGAFYHDSIEDTRVSYNDVMQIAREHMTEEQARMATEIVYALTNEKGRTRAERAGEKYYQGIRTTPYAPFVKLCDRLANVTYSCTGEGPKGTRMKNVYKDEMAHFLSSIDPHSEDIRLQVPEEVVIALAEILIEEQDRDEALRQWGEY